MATKKEERKTDEKGVDYLYFFDAQKQVLLVVCAVCLLKTWANVIQIPKYANSTNFTSCNFRPLFVSQFTDLLPRTADPGIAAPD